MLAHSYVELQGILNMNLTKLSVFAVIVDLTLVSITDTPPALASGMPDPASLSNNPITPKSFVMPNNQQSLNIQKQPRPAWGLPYWLNGNLCREQGVDTVCLTPQEANNLRWPIPASQNHPKY